MSIESNRSIIKVKISVTMGNIQIFYFSKIQQSLPDVLHSGIITQSGCLF